MEKFRVDFLEVLFVWIALEYFLDKSTKKISKDFLEEFLKNSSGKLLNESAKFSQLSPDKFLVRNSWRRSWRNVQRGLELSSDECSEYFIKDRKNFWGILYKKKKQERVCKSILGGIFAEIYKIIFEVVSEGIRGRIIEHFSEGHSWKFGRYAWMKFKWSHWTNFRWNLWLNILGTSWYNFWRNIGYLLEVSLSDQLSVKSTAFFKGLRKGNSESFLGFILRRIFDQILGEVYKEEILMQFMKESSEELLEEFSGESSNKLINGFGEISEESTK